MKKTFPKKFLFALMFFAVQISQKSVAGEIIRLTKETMHLTPKGKEKDAMIGDWLIRNNKVVAVVGDAYPEREANQMVSSIQGSIIDFSTLEANNDQLVVYYAQGARVDVASADTIIVLKGKGSEVALKVVKYPTKAEPFTAETIYTLKDNESFIHVATTYRNSSAAPVKILLYDMLRGENKQKDIAPSGQVKMAYMYNKWYNSAYGVMPDEGTVSTPEKVEAGSLITLGYKFYYGNGPKDFVMLDPGKSVSINRKFLTGKDLTDLKAQEAAIAGTKLSKTEVQLKDVKGKNLVNVFVDVYNEKNEMVGASTTNAAGKATLLLPQGNYKLEASKVENGSVKKDISVPSANPVALTLEVESHVSFHVNSAEADGKIFPAKLEFKGINGTKTPDLGPQTRSNGNGDLYYSKNVDFTVPIPAGNYEVVVSHGAEYNAEKIAVTVKPGVYNTVTVNLKRAYSTPNYIISDLHNHTTGSGDSNSGIPDRVINIAASGVEFAPATEHNRISTFSEVIKNEGLRKFLASAPGIELSGRPGPGSTNHQIAFPLRIQENKRGYGAPKTDRNPYVQMKRLYDYDNGKFKLMQQNHPEISQLYFDKDNDGVADGGYGTEKVTDVMEVRESMQELPNALAGKNTRTRSFQWLQMLNLGYRIYGTSNSDNHAVGHPSGGLFNFVYTKDDNPLSVDSVEIAGQVKQGHVIMSNGPFMEVKVNNALPGEEIKADGGKINVHVKVMTANWCPVNKVVILINGKADSSLTFTKNNHAEMFKKGPAIFDQVIPVTLKSDAHVIVMAYGAGETVSMVTGGNMKNHMPMALSNPVFVDTDNNKFTPNKDLMGSPLPVKPRKGKPSGGEDN